MNPFKAGRGFRSGLCRLRKWFRDCVFTRRNGIHLLTHVILSLLLHAALSSLGVPDLVAVLVIATMIVVVESAIDGFLDKEADV